MTKAEICRAISEKLEPTFVTSIGGFPNFWEPSKGGWKPLGFFASEEASARLFDWLRENRRFKQFRELNNRLAADTEDRKALVAAYVCEALSIEVGTISE